MKKIFTLLSFLMLGAMAFAQQYYVFADKDGNVIEDGATITRTEVEDGCRSRMQRQDEALHYLLGFGTGNEGIGRHVDAEAAEVRVADDVLDRAVAFEVFGGPVETQQVGLIDGVIAMQQELGFVPTKEGLEEHVDKGAQFPFRIEGAEFGEVVPLDVAHAVGGDVHVGGVHGGGC